MFDRRVVRGSTYATPPILVSNKLNNTIRNSCIMHGKIITHLSQIDGEQSIAARQAEARRRNLARKRAQVQATKALVARVGSPPPVPGRKHEPVQTEVYLEEVKLFFILAICQTL